MYKTNIYVCYTVMHLYLSILKVNKQFNVKNILIITDHIHDYEFFKDQITKSKLFDEVLIIYDQELNKKFTKNITNFIFYKRKILNFFEKESFLPRLLNGIKDKIEIYLFLDQTRTSQYFLVRYNELVLIEDGLSIYIERNLTIKDIIKRILQMPNTYGRDKRIKKIEATRPEKLPRNIKDKAVKLDIDYLQRNADKNKQDLISKLFINKNIELHKHNKILLLTQPYSEDKFVSEEKKIETYLHIVNNYINDFIVYIKPHPRELTNYYDIFKNNRNIVIFDKNFPIEILDVILKDKFDKGITINSSALYNLNCIKEKIFLGIDFFQEIEKKTANIDRINR